MFHASCFRLHGRGFTLIELLVVVGITVLMASLVLINFRSGKMRMLLSQEAQTLVSQIRRAQSLAISGVGIKDTYCGYGVKVDHLNSVISYIVYADVSASCATTNNKYDGGDVILETIQLHNGIEFETFFMEVDVFFKPPEPTTYINQDNGFGLDAVLVLNAPGFSLEMKTIRISTAGLVQVD